MIKRVLAVLIALFVALSPFSAYAADEVEFDTTATKVQVVDALYDTVADGMKVSIDAFAASLEAAGWVWDALTGTYYDPLNNIEYGILLNGLLGRSDRSGGGGRVRVESAADVKISGKTFSEICKQLEDQYAPHIQNEYDYLTWQNEVNPNYIGELTFYNNGYPNGWTEVYMVPYYRDAQGLEWYGRTQVHAYLDDEGYGRYDYIDMLTIGAEYLRADSTAGPMPSFPYVHFFVGDGIRFMYYEEYADFLKATKKTSYKKIPSYSSGMYFRDAYMSESVSYSDISSQFSAKPTGDEIVDIGYIIYNEPIVLDGYIDPIPVADDDVVTLTGDTIYDYSITNTEGDTTTINNYITNNYVIPETPDDGSDNDSSGSSGSGDVSVSGKIDVGGSVDINVNVSSGSGEGVEFDQDVSLKNYYDWMTEETAGFSEFMGGFLSWLPVPIVTLLCCGFGAVVLMRFIGR